MPMTRINAAINRRTALVQLTAATMLAAGAAEAPQPAPPLAPLHDKIKAAITDNSNLPIKYLVDTHFHGEQTGGNAPFHRDGAIIVAQDNVRVRLLAGTTNGLSYNKSPPAHSDAIPTETSVGGA